MLSEECKIRIHRKWRCLLPYPNASCSGSFTSGLIRPSFRNRSGLKTRASGYTNSLRKIALFDAQTFVTRMPQNRVAYHVFSMIVVPAGMNHPLYTSSSINRCGAPGGSRVQSTRNTTQQEDTPTGVGGLHRRTSFTMAEM